MSSMLRSIVCGGMLAVMAMLAMSVSARAESPAERQAALRTASRAAIYGPEVKKLKVAGHEFNVKKAKIVHDHMGTRITGQISHHLSLRPDDQLYYTIQKIDGTVRSVEIKIDRGGLTPYVTKFAVKYLGLKFAETDIRNFLSNIGQKIDGKWESAAELIVTSVALRAPESDAPAKTSYKPKSAK